MSEKVKIASLEINNVKRVKAVYIEPTANGLTTIGGNNGQGKTSVIDALMNSLLGDKYKPSDPIHHGATKGETTVRLTNGLVVTRRYTKSGGSYLDVKTEAGAKAGNQQTLNSLLSELALNTGKFLQDTPKAKAKALMQALGIDTQPYDEKISELMAQRLDKGRERDRAQGHYESLPYHEGVEAIKSVDEILKKLDDATTANQHKRELQTKAKENRAQLEAEKATKAQLEAELAKIKDRIAQNEERIGKLTATEVDLIATWRAAPSIDTEPIQAEIRELEEYNAKARDNKAKAIAKDNWEKHGQEYHAMTQEIEQVRAELLALLDANPLPLEGLTIEDGELIYKGQAWDCMSGSEKLKVATAVCHLINPSCGFVLVDGLESMDAPTLAEYGEWLRERGLQAIGTRVSTGSECTLIITDGTVADDEIAETKE